MIEWKPIKNYETLYKVSNNGDVISLEKVYIGNKGGVHHKKEQFLKPGISMSGYLGVVLCDKGINKNARIHRLVAEAFIPNPYNKPVVNHINGIKTDNRVKNLEWVTKRENEEHAKINNLLAVNSKNSMTKFKESDVLKMRQLRKKGFLLKKLCSMFNISKGHLSDIINNKKRTYV